MKNTQALQGEEDISEMFMKTQMLVLRQIAKCKKIKLRELPKVLSTKRDCESITWTG